MNQFLTAKQAMRCFATYALGGAKIPHGVSNPVFRKTGNGKYALSAFVFTFTREMLASDKSKAPTEWILIDPIDGKLISRISCTSENFSDLNETEVDLKPESKKSFSKKYKTATLMLLDMLIKTYAETGRVDAELNDAYMYMMMQPVSVGLKPYYKALNQI